MGPTCEQLSDGWTDYLEGQLPWRQRLQARLHLFWCVHCLRYVRQLRATAGALRRVELGPQPQPEVLTALIALYRQEFRDTRSQSVPWPDRVLARIDLALQGWRSAVVSLLLFGIVVAQLATADLHTAGPAGAPGCIVLQAAVLGGVLGMFAVLVGRSRVRLAQRTWATMTLLGAVGAFTLAQGTCGESLFFTHVLRYHLGGSFGLALAGYLTLRWWTFARRAS